MGVAIAERPATTMQSTSEQPPLGELFRRAYAGAWRADAPPLDLTLEEVAAILPQLIDFGGVGLVWPRLRDNGIDYGAAGMALDFGYRRQRERNAEAPGRIAAAVTILRDAGVDPVLVKGWSVSRHYPLDIVRLSGDIDLVVQPQKVEIATSVLAQARRKGRQLDVDLHTDRSWQDIPRADFRAFTGALDVGGTSVRVLRPELHLHVLCHHFMRHATLRPLWLCDIALLLEARPDRFDWELCLGDDRRRRGWVITALGLAHCLLGARIDDTPIAAEARRIPAWLPAAVLRRWELGEIQSQSVMSEIGSRGVLTALTRHRWPDPVGATVFLGAPFNAFPRLPLQWAAFLYRSATYGLPLLAGEAARRARGIRSAHTKR